MLYYKVKVIFIVVTRLVSRVKCTYIYGPSRLDVFHFFANTFNQTESFVCLRNNVLFALETMLKVIVAGNYRVEICIHLSVYIVI
jgi:hypothetical protein